MKAGRPSGRDPKGDHRRSEPDVRDAERLAGLLDGRLDREARAALLRRLTESDVAFQTLVEATRVVESLERGEASTGDDG